MVVANSDKGIGASRPNTRPAPMMPAQFMAMFRPPLISEAWATEADHAVFGRHVGADVLRTQLGFGFRTRFVIDVQHHGLAAVGDDVAGHGQSEARTHRP